MILFLFLVLDIPILCLADGVVLPAGPWPQVFILGCQKCATTSLFDLFRKHPSLCVAKRFHWEPHFYEKELHFFNVNERFSKGLGFYLKHFGHDRHCSADGKYMDATPNYLDELSIQRLNQSVAEAFHTNLRFITILREPIERDLSWYNHQQTSQFYDLGDLRKWFVYDRSVPTKSYANYTRARFMLEANGGKSSLRFGTYDEKLVVFNHSFLRNQLLVVNFDFFMNSEKLCVLKMLNFIGVRASPLHGVRMIRANEKKSGLKVRMDSVDCATRKQLAEYYRPHNEKLYALLDGAHADGSSPSQEPEFEKFRDNACVGS